MEIARLPNTASAEEVANHLREEGCAIVERLVAPEVMDRIHEELDPHFQKWGMSQSFLGSKTQRMCRLPAKSRSSHEVIIQPTVLGAVDGILGPECYHFIVNHTEANRLHPGQGTQNVHRDDTLYPFKHPCRPLLVAGIWAVTDFTEDNGASYGVPGSHLWDDERKPVEEEYRRAAMPKGSVFLFNASLYHGGGRNTTADQVRAGLIIIYGVGWLRPGENPILAAPPELARTFPRKLQDLYGYRNHGYINHYEFQSPRVVLERGYDAHEFAATDLYDEYDSISVNKR